MDKAIKNSILSTKTPIFVDKRIVSAPIVPPVATWGVKGSYSPEKSLFLYT